MSREARVRLAFVGMHPSRRRGLEERLGGPGGLLDGVVGGSVDVPEHARSAAAVPAKDRLESLGDLRLVLAGDDGYPDPLDDLPDRPDALFMAGGPMIGGPSVAVVGSRAATRYGLELSRALGRAFASAGYVVVSGLAKGIDGAAHRGCLDASGTTVAVLGNGHGRWYPASHRDLGESILGSDGSVITEYPPGTPPAAWRFPLRNRIISGMADAVVVVEAAVTGGALITARSALAQGRDVLAVPGDLGRATSEGCNKLIADGAVPVTSVDDAVAALDLITGRTARERVDHPLAEVLGPTGRSLEELVEVLNVGFGEVLSTVGRWEVEGLARVDAGRVVVA